VSEQSALRRALEVVAGGAEAPGELLAAAFGEIMDGEASAAAMAALLAALRTRGETVAELAAVARALRARAETAPLRDPRTLDTCGTGGDGAGTFNISTIAAFAVAGAGGPGAKHGTRAASGRCGSADLLEALGVAVDLPVAAAARVLEEVGIGFFFARRAHPAMRHVAEVRQQLGIRTLMNCMGPLLNPVGAKLQLVGVYDGALVQPIAKVLGQLGSQRALVVHGGDGLDEITTTDITHAALLSDGAVRGMELDPARWGVARPAPGALAGGDAAQNAAIANAVLANEAGAARDIVLVNAGAALFIAGAAPDIEAGMEQAAQSLASGAARAKLEALVAATQANP